MVFHKPEIFKRHLFARSRGYNSKFMTLEEIQNASKGETFKKFNKIKAQIQKRELFVNPKLNLRLLSEEA